MPLLRKTRFWLPLLLAISLAGSLPLLYDRFHSVDLFYTVQLDPAHVDRPLVKLRIQRFPSLPFNATQSLVLQAPVQDEYFQITDLQAHGASLDKTTDVARRLRIDWHTTTYKVRYSGNQFTVSYRSRIGIREGSGHTGYSGLKLGEARPDLGVVSGSNLFLFPAERRVRSIRLKIVNNLDAGLVTPWTGQHGLFVPGVEGRFQAESLVRSSFAWGDFETRGFPHRSFRLYCHASKEIPPEHRRSISERAHQVMSYLEDVFGPHDGGDIHLILLPRLSGGYDLHSPHWTDNVAASVYPPTPWRWRRFSSRLLDIYLKHKPSRREVHRPEDYWLVQGLNFYYQERILEGISRTSMASVLGRYESALRERDGVRLTQVHAKNFRYLQEIKNFEMKAVYVLVRIDRLIREATGDKQDLDDFIAYYFSRGQQQDFRSSLERYLRSRTVGQEIGELLDGFMQKGDSTSGGLNVGDRRASQPSRRSALPAASHDRVIRLAHVARLQNYLENCGCKTNQSGGIARLSARIHEVRRRDPDTILLNLGDNVPVEKGEMEIQDLTMAETDFGFSWLASVDFDAVNLRTTELLYGVDKFAALQKSHLLPYLSSDVKQDGRLLLPPAALIERQGLKIGLFGLSTKPTGGLEERIFADNTFHLGFEDQGAVIRETVKRLRKEQGAELVVLLCSLEPEAILSQVVGRGVDLVVTSTVPSKPSSHVYGDTYFLGDTLVIHSDLGPYGLIESEIFLRGREIAAARSEVVQLSEEYPEDPKVRADLDRFYAALEGRFESAPKLALWTEESSRAGFVGAETCGACHSAQHRQWLSTSHSTAFATLVRRHRNLAPGCVECHVTGFQRTPGFTLRQGADPMFQNVQCEMCHGPGSEHILAPAANRLKREPDFALCQTCHNQEHSDLTIENFEQYYMAVSH